MRFVMFYHSLVSDWNHGNAHFLRGIVAELLARGHDVTVAEPCSGWSLTNLLKDQGWEALTCFRRAFPDLPHTTLYDPRDPRLHTLLAGVDVVLVHEWTDPALVAALSRHRKSHDYRLLFHDTHHRAVTSPDDMDRLDLSGYDGALVFGQALQEVYRSRGWVERSWVWHEAADTRTFYPREGEGREGDVVWIGNWGDDERTMELEEFLFTPVRRRSLTCRVHGVRYPAHVRRKLAAEGIDYRGWIANHRVPEAFARFAATVHVPRRIYSRELPGIPTIRVFEALACGIPLVTSPWSDSEGLFRPGRDFLVAQDGSEMERMLWELANDAELRLSLCRSGLERIQERHTCAHRVDELLNLLAGLGRPALEAAV